MLYMLKMLSKGLSNGLLENTWFDLTVGSISLIAFRYIYTYLSMEKEKGAEGKGWGWWGLERSFRI